MSRAVALFAVALFAVTQIACSSESTPSPVAAQDAGEAEVTRPVDDIPQPHPGPCTGKPDGVSCDDNSVCTEGDHCADGLCVSDSILPCVGGGPCTPALCDPKGGCVERALPDGAPCTAPCFSAGSCRDGLCVGSPGAEAPCPASSDPCVTRVDCEPETGSCDRAVLTLACPSDSRCFSTDGVLACLLDHPTLCRPCSVDGDCADPDRPERTHRCLASVDGMGSFCGSDCRETTCPDSYVCDSASDPPQCVPSGDATCACDPLWASLGFATSCSRTNEHGTCTGSRRCVPGGLSACTAKVPRAELCNGADDDCNGETDEGMKTLCGPEGACCLPDGTCGPRLKQSCLASGGRFSGAGLTCAQAACGVSPGACCGVVGCAQVYPASCAASYRGDGMVCSLALCAGPPPTGACCMPDGSCSIVEATACSTGGGLFAGDGVNCPTAACAPTGACCLPDKSCVSIGQVACTDQGGQFSLGTACLGTGCPLPKGMGACCDTSGTCAIETGEACASKPGQFLLAEACVGQCQAPDFGACCHIGGTCSMVPVAACEPTTSAWKGGGTLCPAACAAPTGACCKFTNCYPNLSDAQCGFVSGSWLGVGTACTPNACP